MPEGNDVVSAWRCQPILDRGMMGHFWLGPYSCTRTSSRSMKLLGTTAVLVFTSVRS